MNRIKELAALFSAYGLTLALAESCTAGLLSACIADQPGCSAWFRGGVVAYHNDLKQHLLNVPLALLEQHGAVSEQVCLAMATGVRQCCNADLGLSVTGIAGPDGGTAAKPVGTVYIGLADAAGCQVVHCQFLGDRAAIRQQAVEQGLFMLKNRLLQPETA